jgi:hypothetical protein
MFMFLISICLARELVIAAESATPVMQVPSLDVERARLVKLKAREFEKLKAEALNTSLNRSTRAVAVWRIAELGTKDAAQFLAEIWDNPINVVDW